MHIKYDEFIFSTTSKLLTTIFFGIFLHQLTLITLRRTSPGVKAAAKNQEPLGSPRASQRPVRHLKPGSKKRHRQEQARLTTGQCCFKPQPESLAEYEASS
jgi:hypothetical protein